MSFSFLYNQIPNVNGDFDSNEYGHVENEILGNPMYLFNLMDKDIQKLEIRIQNDNDHAVDVGNPSIKLCTEPEEEKGKILSSAILLLLLFLH